MEKRKTKQRMNWMVDGADYLYDSVYTYILDELATNGKISRHSRLE